MQKRFLAGGVGLLFCLGILTSCKEATSDVTVPEEVPDASVLQAPPPPPPSAFLALLTPEQTAVIKELGVPLVLPTLIPEGFQVESVAVEPGDRFAGYQILYRDGSDRCFVVEHTTGGVGGIPTTESRVPITLPILDNSAEFGLNYGQYVDPNMRNQAPEPELMSDWLPIQGNFYRLAGAKYINRILTPARPCTDLAPEEALQIIESFALITDEITGDG